jgi:bifunctional DNA-binding transcriptional regulator/antitoxin component of YhaV-PrlF toxin-antitoxin module
MVEVVKLKPNGSLVIPRAIRQALGLAAQEPLVLVTDHDTLLLKRVSPAHARRQLRSLTHEFGGHPP